MRKSLRVVLLSSVVYSTSLDLAHSADSLAADPVEFVRVCELHGAGFWYFPGTDTCVQMGGYARFQAHLNADNLGHDPWEGNPLNIRDGRTDLENDTFSLTARGLINFDARTETEYGALRSFIQMRGTAYDEDNASVELDLAFLQFAGFTAGLAPSFFIIEVPTEYMGHHVADFSEDQLVFAYTAELGGGVSASLALESGERANQDGWVLIDSNRTLILAPGADWIEATEAPNDFPAVVAAVRVEQAWGSAGISGAVAESTTRIVEIDGETDDVFRDHIDSDLGWAISGGLTIKLPVLGESSAVSLKAGYSERLSFYTLGVLPPLTWIGNEIASADVFTLFGGLTHYWSPTLRSSLALSLFDADLNFSDDSQLQGVTASANVIWSPIKNLDVGLELLYSNLDADHDGARVLGLTTEDDRLDDDGFGAIFRIQRNFGS